MHEGNIFGWWLISFWHYLLVSSWHYFVNFLFSLDYSLEGKAIQLSEEEKSFG